MEIDMARLMERHDTQWVLIADDGRNIGTLNKMHGRWQLYQTGEVDFFHTFNSPDECFDWLLYSVGMVVEFHSKSQVEQGRHELEQNAKVVAEFNRLHRS